MEERGGRKGITPVIAVVLLVFITVVAAGGAFVFMQEVRTQFIQDLQQEYQVEAVLEHVFCSQGRVNATITNTGEKEIAVDAVNLWVVERETGRKNLSASRTNFNLAANQTDPGPGIVRPDTTGVYSTAPAGQTRLKTGEEYVIEYEFLDNNAYTLRGRCIT